MTSWLMVRLQCRKRKPAEMPPGPLARQPRASSSPIISISLSRLFVSSSGWCAAPKPSMARGSKDWGPGSPSLIAPPGGLTRPGGFVWDMERASLMTSRSAGGGVPTRQHTQLYRPARESASRQAGEPFPERRVQSKTCGRGSEDPDPRALNPDPCIMIQVEKLSRRFPLAGGGEVLAVDHITFTVAPGEV